MAEEKLQRGSSEHGGSSPKRSPQYADGGAGTRAARQSAPFSDQPCIAKRRPGAGWHHGKHRREKKNRRHRASNRGSLARARPAARQGGRSRGGRRAAG